MLNKVVKGMAADSKEDKWLVVPTGIYGWLGLSLFEYEHFFFLFAFKSYISVS